MGVVDRVPGAIRGAGLVALTIGLAACSIPDVTQVSLPRVDFAKMMPTDQSQYAGQIRNRTIGPNDLVDAGGRCAGAPSAQASAGGEQAAPAASQAAPAVRGVGLQMTECEVVGAAGTPESVQIGANERGERSVTMIYATPERPTYRFVSGRLVSIERGAEPPPEPAKKKAAPKKPAKKQQAT